MKKYIKFILPLVLIILLFGFWNLKIRSQKTNVQNEKTIQTVSASLTIINGSNTQNFDISSFIGKTALEATEANTQVVANGTGMNAFITSLDGKTIDPKKHEFWELLVNGEPSQVGAGSYSIQNNDQITWKINTY
jgi:hypothetical protein